MSDNKKDLTRIEDLAEYLHELNENGESDLSSYESTSGLPDVPSEETDFSSSSFGEEESSFTSEEPAFGTEETSFETSESSIDFGASDFSGTDFGGTDFGGEDFESPKSEEETTSDDLFEASSESTETKFEDTTTTSVESTTNNTFEDNTFSDSNLEPEPEPTPTYTPPAQETYKAPENFEDLKKFAESSSVAGMGVEGNPSFSVLLKNVRYTEDVNDILSMLKELNLLTDSEEQIKNRLMRGHLLIPRISEYAAIFLAHKLRRFDIDIQVGLSDEIHPPKHQETPETGIVSKHSLYQNQIHHFHFDDPKLELAQIIIAASNNLEGHQVIRYLGVASEHKMLEGHIVEDEGSEEIPRHYSELAHKLKAHALKAHANAVIGLNYQLTPLPSEYGMSGSKYRLSCTGNLVWVNKL